MEDINIALVQMNALVGKITDNLARHEYFIRKAAQKGVELLCFPELSITGHWPDPRRWDVSESVPGGQSVRLLKELCVKYGIFVSAGIAEKGGVCVYNTQFIVGPDGFLGKQRKLHPSGDEYFFYRAGSSIEIIDIGKAKIGIAICFDNMFPEVQRVLAIKGSEIILMPHAARCGNKWPLSEKAKKETVGVHKFTVKKIFASRCYDNGQFGLYCNQVGRAGPKVNHAGGLTVLGPDGSIIADSDNLLKEKMLITTLSAKILDDRRKCKCFNLLVRRPDLYTELTKND